MFPELTEQVEAELGRHNADWSGRWQVWCRYGGVPGCGLGQIVTPSLRAWVDSFLPWKEFALSLRRLGRAFLPSPDWLPLILQHGNPECPVSGKEHALHSILDFWQELPAPFQGRICFRPEELLSLFCTLADPPRYGTIPGKYPDQVRLFQELLQKHLPEEPLRLLDLGCGVALGSLEILQIAMQAGYCNAELTGLTAQPLEAWMASRKNLPHDPRRESILQHRFAGLKGEFLVGRVQDFQLPNTVDFIFCNGLAGGRYLWRDGEILSFLAGCRRHLSDTGCLLLANHFHQGCRSAVKNMLNLAKQQGWVIKGHWQNLQLTRS